MSLPPNRHRPKLERKAACPSALCWMNTPESTEEGGNLDSEKG